MSTGIFVIDVRMAFLFRTLLCFDRSLHTIGSWTVPITFNSGALHRHFTKAQKLKAVSNHQTSWARRTKRKKKRSLLTSKFFGGFGAWHLILNDHSTNENLIIAADRKDLKKVTKLEAQIPYHEGRGNKEEVEKIKAQVADIWAKTREAAFD
jgi:hypothetical protein